MRYPSRDSVQHAWIVSSYGKMILIREDWLAWAHQRQSINLSLIAGQIGVAVQVWRLNSVGRRPVPNISITHRDPMKTVEKPHKEE